MPRTESEIPCNYPKAVLIIAEQRHIAIQSHSGENEKRTAKIHFKPKGRFWV